MFEPAFKKELILVKASELQENKFWEEIKKEYADPQRQYHSLAHLDNLLKELLPVKEKINDWQTIIFSIAYHDIVYNAVKQDNEEKSAAIAWERMTQLKIPTPQKNSCKDQILATKGHHISADPDINYFTDADLAILGSDYDTYRNYFIQIRKEYKFYPDLLYMPGRKKVLNYFLKMNSIYKTAYFIERYELRARQNLIRELEEIA